MSADYVTESAETLAEAREALNAVISRHAPHGFDGVMRTADQGCETYLLAVKALGALAARPAAEEGDRG